MWSLISEDAGKLSDLFVSQQILKPVDRTMVEVFRVFLLFYLPAWLGHINVTAKNKL